mmetsp:Transcript_1520/g.3961  ORF Transcript_1520/g.3961 Transcript_1520/m.3961 type:complete len:136 (-) Transcript_1520:289-696(-)
MPPRLPAGRHRRHLGLLQVIIVLLELLLSLVVELKVRIARSEKDDTESDRRRNDQTVELSRWKLIELGNHVVDSHAYCRHRPHCLCHCAWIGGSKRKGKERKGTISVSNQWERKFRLGLQKVSVMSKPTMETTVD